MMKATICFPLSIYHSPLATRYLLIAYCSLPIALPPTVSLGITTTLFSS